MEKINAVIMLEMLGKPKDYLLASFESIIDRLSKEKGIKIIKKSINEPRPVENSKELLTTFSELEVEFESVESFLGIIFAYMPSHVEIVSPEKIVLTDAHLNDISNALLQRLHNYDAVVKKTLADRETLLLKLKEVAPNLFRQTPVAQKTEEKPKEGVSKSRKKKKKK